MPDESCRLFDQEIKGEDEYNAEQQNQGKPGAAAEEEIFVMNKPEDVMQRGMLSQNGQGR